jgi:hypothetical protein
MGSSVTCADALTPAPAVDPLVGAVPAFSKELEGSSADVEVDGGAGGGSSLQPRRMSSGRTITHTAVGRDCPIALGAVDAASSTKPSIESAVRRSWGLFGTGDPFAPYAT